MLHSKTRWKKKWVSVICAVTYVGYCLLQQHGLSENLLHILSQFEKYVLVYSSPPNLYHVHFLLWELGKAQGHMALKDIQFTFCSRTQSHLIKLSLIGL